MPDVLRVGPYRFLFYSLENGEPPHVHVKRDRQEAKYWLTPDVELAANLGFAKHELNRIERIVVANVELFLKEWHEHFD